MAIITTITPLLSWFLREQPVSSKFNSELRNKVNTLITNHVAINNGLEGLLAGASAGDSQAKIAFGLASAPTSWTRDTSFSNDQLLRIIDGVGGGEAGNWGISGFTTDSVDDHTHSLGAHVHGVANHTHTLTAHTHNNGSHTHPLINHTSEALNVELQLLSAGGTFGTLEVLPITAATATHTHASSSHGHPVVSTSYSTPVTVSTGGAQGQPTSFPQSGIGVTPTAGPSTDVSGLSPTHAHSISNDGTWRPQYLNMLLCKKD